MAKDDYRSHVWTFLVYPDSVNENWLFLLDSLHIPICVSPLHDKDFNPTGEPKKPHKHIFQMGRECQYILPAILVKGLSHQISVEVELPF